MFSGFFTGGSGDPFGFDDFDVFINILEGGDKEAK